MKVVNQTFPRRLQTGFTLVEIAMVLLIVSILLAGLVPTLSSQMEQKNRSETRKKLEEIKEALVGYAVINGRLPCPASSTSFGIEDPPNAATGVACNHPYDGFVPGATLGLSGLDNQGYAVDGWNYPIHYAVTTNSLNAFTTTNGMRNNFSTLAPDLLVCSTASATTNSCSVANSGLTTGVPAVIYSTGSNGGNGGASADENENPNRNPASKVDRVFVSHDTTPDFDDMVIWLSPNTLFNRMIAAGKLP